LEPRQVFRAYEGAPSADPALFCIRCGGECIDADEGGQSRRTCSRCGHIHYRNPTPAVSVLVVEGERFLICRRQEHVFRGGFWCIPGGYMEFDEDYLTAGKREVLEETGLEVDVLGLLSVASNFLAPSLHSLSIILLARPAGGTLKPGDDIAEARWHGLDEPLPPMAFESHAHIVARYAADRLAGAPVDPRYAVRRLAGLLE
jgi:8-oxo-dGTP diphosphatase